MFAMMMIPELYTNSQDALLSGLNDAQAQAVTASARALLVLAGAGSGKTRVLVHRMAWLIREQHIAPHRLLAVTFTNKAAHEMRVRVEQLLGQDSGRLWIGTFHGIAHRLLRLHWQVAGLAEDFQIIDSDDQLRLLKRILKNCGVNEKDCMPKSAQWFIAHQKDQGLLPHQVENDGDWKIKQLIEIYQAYEVACAQSSLIDFGDLILKTHRLWLEQPDLRAHYQQRFAHILVDEFQDTNTLQYAWLQLLMTDPTAIEQNAMTAVGDDDQSIYGWRGASSDNLQRFTQEYSDSQLIRLEENYRSTQMILNAANGLIACNANRLGKELWTSGEPGERVTRYTAADEQDEARYVGQTLRTYLQAGYKGCELAILYRSNAQSRALEESLLRLSLPYRIYGGMRFFERAEIKEGLAYLQLINNRHNNSAFERVVNTPARRIGDRTLKMVNETALREQCSFWQAANNLVQAYALGKSATEALAGFMRLIDDLAQSTQDCSLGEQVNRVVYESGLHGLYAGDSSERGQGKLENLLELINAAHQFSFAEEDNTLSPLAAFLAHASLDAGDSAVQTADRIQLMTLHAAKGLEFPIVLIVGLENGLFPSYPAMQLESRLEEERRLCYVGITRAMKKLHLCHAEARFLHGQTQRHAPSLFLKEVPLRCLDSIHYARQMVTPTTMTYKKASPTVLCAQAASGFYAGQRVKHTAFGEGVVLQVEAGKDYDRIHINFENHGAKWIMSSPLLGPVYNSLA